MEQPQEEVEKVMQDFLDRKCFRKTSWNGEECYVADSLGVKQKDIRYLKYIYCGGVFHIEAWCRNLQDNTESGLDFSMGYEREYLDEILLLLRHLLALIPKDSPLAEKNKDILKDDKRMAFGSWLLGAFICFMSIVYLYFYFRSRIMG